MASVHFFVLDLLGFSDAPTYHYTLSLFLSVESSREPSP